MNKLKKQLRKIKKLKEWLMIEIGILAVILIAAVAVCVDMGKLPDLPAPVQVQAQQEQQPTEKTEPTESTVPESTAPQPSTPTVIEPTWMELPEGRELTAQKAFVYNNDELIYNFIKGTPDEKIYPASITKLLTAYVALRFLIPDETIVVGDVIDKIAADSSRADLKKGDVLTVEQLIAALLLPSGNDAAYILAEAAGQEAEADDSLKGDAAISIFMREMNGQAKLFGMTNTNFTNPDGYHDDNHYTTMADLVKLVQHVTENEIIMKYAKTSEMKMTLGENTLTWTNTNKLIDPASVYYCPYVTGLKTGQTEPAGCCLISTFQIDEVIWTVGVFGCPTRDSRFEDTLQLLNEVLFAKE